MDIEKIIEKLVSVFVEDVTFNELVLMYRLDKLNTEEHKMANSYLLIITATTEEGAQRAKDMFITEYGQECLDDLTRAVNAAREEKAAQKKKNCLSDKELKKLESEPPFDLRLTDEEIRRAQSEHR